MLDDDGYGQVDEELLCGCGARARGDVESDVHAPAHFCRQCSVSHCELARVFRADERRRASIPRQDP